MPPKKIVKNSGEYKYEIKNGEVWKCSDDEDEKPKRICKSVEVLQVNHDVDTGKILLLVRFDYHGIVNTMTIPRDTLQRSKITGLINYGVDVQDDPVMLREMLQYLRWADDNATLCRTHTQLGLSRINERLVFKHSECSTLGSTYTGQLSIKPRGTLDEYIALLQKEVIGQTPLELALALGLAATISSMLAEETGMEVMVVHLCGNSSSGKSTACMLAVSPYGSPNTKENGLLKTWNATESSLMAQLAEVHGIPIVFDEASINRAGMDFTKIIYKIASGKDKERLNRSAERQVAKSFSGLCLSNAEHSLRDKGSQNIGIQVRLIELANVKWTRSAENSEAIKEGVLKHYGHMGPAFADKLIELGPEAVMNRWKEWRDTIRRRINSPDDFSKRISDKLAIIALAADLIQEWFGLTLDIDGIVDILINSVDDAAENRNLGQKAHQYVIDEVIRNRSKFATGEQAPENSHEYWGKIVSKNTDAEIWILPHILKKILAEGQFDDVNIVLKLWRDENLLDHDPDKFTRKKVMQQGMTSRVNVIKMKLESPAATKNASIRIARPRKTNSIFDEID